MTDPPVFGWVQRFVDEKVGGWRLAPGAAGRAAARSGSAAKAPRARAR